MAGKKLYKTWLLIWTMSFSILAQGSMEGEKAELPEAKAKRLLVSVDVDKTLLIHDLLGPEIFNKGMDDWLVDLIEGYGDIKDTPEIKRLKVVVVTEDGRYHFVKFSDYVQAKVPSLHVVGVLNPEVLKFIEEKYLDPQTADVVLNTYNTGVVRVQALAEALDRYLKSLKREGEPVGVHALSWGVPIFEDGIPQEDVLKDILYHHGHSKEGLGEVAPPPAPKDFHPVFCLNGQVTPLNHMANLSRELQGVARALGKKPSNFAKVFFKVSEGGMQKELTSEQVHFLGDLGVLGASKWKSLKYSFLDDDLGGDQDLEIFHLDDRLDILDSFSKDPRVTAILVAMPPEEDEPILFPRLMPMK